MTELEKRAQDIVYDLSDHRWNDHVRWSDIERVVRKIVKLMNQDKISSDNAIIVWRFRDAPQEYRALSQSGGDEDWLALVPASMAGDWISWLDKLGVCDVDEFMLPDGRKVVIGSHS